MERGFWARPGKNHGAAQGLRLGRFPTQSSPRNSHLFPKDPVSAPRHRQHKWNLPHPAKWPNQRDEFHTLLIPLDQSFSTNGPSALSGVEVTLSMLRENSRNFSWNTRPFAPWANRWQGTGNDRRDNWQVGASPFRLWQQWPISNQIKVVKPVPGSVLERRRCLFHRPPDQRGARDVDFEFIPQCTVLD